MCLQSNETGAIKFFINNWTTNQHYLLQSSSFGKPHTARDVAPTPSSSAGSLHVQVPSAGLSQLFGCCRQFQNDDLWGGIWVSGKARSHMASDQVSMGAAEPPEYPLWSKIPSWRWQCDKERCRDAASPQVSAISPRTGWTFFSELFKDLTIVLFINGLSLRHEFHMNNTLTVEKTN